MSSYSEWSPSAYLNAVQEAASQEAQFSPFPGYNHGPADAYRHLVGVAEMRRRFGRNIAKWLADFNEMAGTHGRRNQSAEARQMDDHNNALALEDGAQARTYEEVVSRARARITAALQQGGTGLDGTPMWRDEQHWSEIRGRTRPPMPQLPFEWPTELPSAAGYRYGAERFRGFPDGTPRQREAALLARLADTPPVEWSEENVRGVIASTPYLNTTTPSHTDWRRRVREYFERRTAGETAARTPAECGGVAQVRAHTRRGPNGAVQVSAHSRAVACG